MVKKCLLIPLILIVAALLACCAPATDPELPEPEVVAGKFYYSALGVKEQALYNTLEGAADAFAPTTGELPYAYTADEWQETFNALVADNPLIFYLNAEACVLSTSGGKSTAALGYIGTTEDINQMRGSYLARINAVFSELGLDNEELSEFDRELLIHDYLVQNVSYLRDADEAGAPHANTAYGAIVDGTALCDGYSYAFKQLCSMAGIECAVVYGSGNSRPHAWNMLKIDGEYTFTDLTWDDPDVDYIENFAFHGYFNLSYEEISRDHAADNPALLPPSGGASNYFKVKGLTAETPEELTALVEEQVKLAIDQRRDTVEVSTALSDEQIEQCVKTALNAASSARGGVLRGQFRIIKASHVTHSFAVQFYYTDG